MSKRFKKISPGKKDIHFDEKKKKERYLGFKNLKKANHLWCFTKLKETKNKQNKTSRLTVSFFSESTQEKEKKSI